MTVPHAIMWAVASVGLVAFLTGRNWTAGALVVAWLAAQFVYLVTGDNLPVHFYLYPDLFVLGVIMAKAEAFDCRPYRGTWHQLKCVLLERSVADRIVMLIFPVQWMLYVSALHPFYVWYALWALTIAQFAAASIESFLTYRRARAVTDLSDTSGGQFQFAWVRGYG